MKNIFLVLWCFLSSVYSIDVNTQSQASSSSTKDQSIQKDQYFNILSLDGAGMNGLVTAKLLSMIEQYAYNYTEKEDIV